MIRRLYRPFVHRYVTVSAHLRDYLTEEVGIARERVETVCNGVDTERFRPGWTPEALPAGFARGAGTVIFGWVGRMEAIKDPVTLARAFVRARALAGRAGRRMRLVMVGDGRERPVVEKVLGEGGVRGAAWLPGARDDVPALLRAMNVFAWSRRATSRRSRAPWSATRPTPSCGPSRGAPRASGR